MNKVNLLQKFDLVTEYWSPKVVGDLNGQQVKLAKFRGEFIWHHHEAEDEAFIVLKGTFRMEYRDHSVTVNEGELLIVPRGVEHKPVADDEAWVMLFEPDTTRNTGNIVNERTKTSLENI